MSINHNHNSEHVTAGDMKVYFTEALTDAIVKSMERFGIDALKTEVATLQRERLIRQGAEEERAKISKRSRIYFGILMAAVQIAAALFIKFYK